MCVWRGVIGELALRVCGGVMGELALRVCGGGWVNLHYVCVEGGDG